MDKVWLSQLSRAFGAYLQHELKLVKGDRLAIILPNLLQYPVALLGALPILWSRSCRTPRSGTSSPRASAI